MGVELQPGQAYRIRFKPWGGRVEKEVRAHVLELTRRHEVDEVIMSHRPWDEGGTSVMRLSDITAATEIPLPKER